MRFDRFMEDEPKAIPAEVLPDGDSVCEITAEKPWTSPDGTRESVILTFTPVSGHAAFDHWFNYEEEKSHKAARQLLAAAGLAGDTDVGAGQLKGKRVTVTTRRATDKAGAPKLDGYTGLQKLWVNGFAPAAQAASQVDEPQWKVNAISKRRPAAKAVGGGSDDIPF
jgi:hypothetical protein